MYSSETDFRTKLVAALAESDQLRRSGRADRIQWLSAHQIQGGMVMGPMDTMAVLQEARECFVEGHYIAALLLSVAFIEHTIADELIERGLAKYGISLIDAIKGARENQLFSPDMLASADHLREIRNPFAHRKNPSHPHSFGNRFMEKEVHPTAILEQDAKDALSLMYAFFHATVKGG